MARTKNLSRVGFRALDSSLEALAKNGQPAVAFLLSVYARSLNELGHAGRTLANWWGYPAISLSGGAFSPPAKDIALRFPWVHGHRPGSLLRGHALLLPTKFTAPYNQGLTGLIDGSGNNYLYGAPTLDNLPTDAAPNPKGLETFDFLGDVDDSVLRLAEVIVGQNISGASYSHKAPDGGILYEAAQQTIDPSSAGAYVPDDWMAADRAIAAASVNSMTNLNRLRLMLLHHWAWMRPQLCWSILNPPDGATAGNYIEFAASPTDFRYIFDQRVGDGGTAPSKTGPGMTFPLYQAARGRAQTMTLAVYVYAAMSGATKTGQIGLASRDGASMSSIVTADANAPTISGTTFQWYSLLGDAPAVWNVKTTDLYNRLVLCARSSDAAEKVRIAAFAFVPVPASNIL